MSFKLLAIRPLEGCNKKFLKNLKENQIYQFYNDYKFILDENQKEVIEIKYTSTVPENLYWDKINVSAIVGKNGSGKSALVELLYVTFYNIAVSEKIINKSQQRSYFKRKIESEFNYLIENKKNPVIDFLKEIVDDFLSHNLNNIISYENSDNDYISVKSKMIKYIEIFKIIYSSYEKNKGNTFFRNYLEEDFKNDFFSIDDIDKFYSSETYRTRNDYLNDSVIEEKISAFTNILNDYVYNLNFIENDVFVEIFFVINEKTIKVSKTKESKGFGFTYYIFEENKNYKFHDLNFKDNEIGFSYLFYNLVINYSLYGLNSNETGKWIEKLFHKNDGYQTPIVINPFRHEGIININSENELVRDRLLANTIINDKLKQVTPNSRIEYLIVKIKKKNEPIHFFYYEIFNKEEYSKFKKQIISFFNSSVNRDKKFKKNDFKLNSLDVYCLEYIFIKLKRIAKNYVIYSKYIIDENDTSINPNNIVKVIALLKELSKDSSHISYKIRQAINFVLLNKLNDEDFIYKKFNKNEPFIENGKYKFSEYSSLINSKSTEYTIDTINLLPPSIFEIDFEFDNGSKFSMLSSGEKQLIFSTNSILYHLINLNSTKGNRFPLKYPYINLILDEIELYAHPEMQRNYINQLIKGIKRLEIQNIKNLNILFITHSPFILSDIPKQNVLFLEVDKEVDEKNEPIFDQNGNEQYFSTPKDFLGDNTFGANIYSLLKESFFMNNFMGDFSIEKIKSLLNYLKNNKNNWSWNQNNSDAFINLISEPMIKDSLRDLFNEKFMKDDKDVRIKSLEEEVKRLNSKLKKNETNFD